MTPHELTLSINPIRAGKFLLVPLVVLTTIHTATMLLWFNDLLPADKWWQIALFDLDEEESFGTWYSTLILFAAGQLCLIQWWLERKSAGRSTGSWLFFAVGFHILSIDEVVGLHEYVNTLAEDTAWTTYGAIIVLIIGLANLPFLARLPSRTRSLFIIAGAIYVGGALGVERATDWYDVNDLMNTLAYNLWTAVEEFMEMSGIVLFIFALLEHIVSVGQKPVRIEIQFRR